MRDVQPPPVDFNERVEPADTASAKAPRPTGVRYRVLAWLAAAAVLAYLCRNSIGVAESTIRRDLGLDVRQMGWVMGAFFWTYALMQVPAGAMGHRWGSRRVLTLCSITWSVAMALMGLAPVLWLLVAAQALMGLAQAGLFPCAVQSVSHWVPGTSRASCCALLAAGMQIGAILAASLTGLLLTGFHWDWLPLVGLSGPALSLPALDWRLAFLLYSVPGLVWAASFRRSFRDRPEEDPSVNEDELTLIRAGSDANPEAEASAGPAPWARVLRSRSVWCLCTQQVFRAAGYAFFASWFPTFLQATRGVSIAESGLLQSTVFAATLVGGLSGGVVVDWVYRTTESLRWSRSGIGAVAMSFCGLLIFSAYFATSPLAAVLLIDLGAFAAAVAGPCAYVATIDLGGRHVSTVFGLMNMSGNLAAAATPVAIGWFFSATQNWNLVLCLFGFAYLLAAVGWLLINPNRTVGPPIAET